MSNNRDAFYMARALAAAQQAIYTADPNPAIGCVLVKNDRIIAEGWTQQPGSAHAEIHALSKTDQANGATAYVTLEPCSHFGKTGPCCDALIAAGIKRVVSAMSDPNPLVSGRGLEKLRTAGVEVCNGVLAESAAKLNRGFFKRMNQGLPWITSKLAASLDGRTALACGESRWISSSAARDDVHRYRAASSAILTGIGTVLQDDPQLNARIDFVTTQPIKVVLDSQLRMPLTAKLLDATTECWIITCSENSKKIQQLSDAGFKIWQLDAINTRPDLLSVFKLLAEQQINTVWVEAGAILNGALLNSNLVDEWMIYLAPCVLGDLGRGMFHLPELQQMTEKKLLKLSSFRQIGPDLRLIYTQQTC